LTGGAYLPFLDKYPYHFILLVCPLNLLPLAQPINWVSVNGSTANEKYQQLYITNKQTEKAEQREPQK
jgi:hypothetical protein